MKAGIDTLTLKKYASVSNQNEMQPKRIENKCPHNNLYKNAQRNSIYNSHKAKTIQMAIN